MGGFDTGQLKSWTFRVTYEMDADILDSVISRVLEQRS